MEALLYFALWAGLFFLMLRLGCGAHVSGHGDGPPGHEGRRAGGPKLRWVPPKTDIDPVCHTTISTDRAKPSVYDGNVYYFCSRECREAFEAAPDLYVGGGDPDHRQLEHSHA